MSANLREYKKVREKYLDKHPSCEAKIDGCHLEANQIHHKKGRIGNLLVDDNYFLAVCGNCHHWIENNPKEAKELGFSLNRLTL